MRGRVQTVDPAELDPLQTSVLDQGRERVHPGDGIRTEREEGAGAALQVRGRRAVREHDVRACLARRPALARRPGERGTVGLRGVGGREDQRPGRFVAIGLARVTERSQAFHGAGVCELGTAQAGDEVPAPDVPGLLHRSEHRVDADEATRDAFGEDRLPA